MTGRVTFVHAARSSVFVFDALARELLPDADVRHVVDQRLEAQVVAAGRITGPVRARLQAILARAFAAGSQLVVVTSATLGPAAEAIRDEHGWAVLRVDEPVVERALELGSRIGVLGTLRVAIDPVVELVRRRAGGREVTIVEHLCEGAWTALRDGDTAVHDAAVQAGIAALRPGVDVVVLAQTSIAAAVTDLEDEKGIPVLASPRHGVERAAILLLLRD